MPALPNGTGALPHALSGAKAPGAPGERRGLTCGAVLPSCTATVPGVGVVAVWFAALFGFLGGFFLIYRAFQERKA